jgi:hypothetical protein
MKEFLFKAVDVIGGGIIYLGGLVLALVACFTGAFMVALSLVCSLAVPALAIVAIWGILKYFGVL